jgi:hypothetical protein
VLSAAALAGQHEPEHLLPAPVASVSQASIPDLLQARRAFQSPLWYQPSIIVGRRVVAMTHRTNLNKINELIQQDEYAE